MFFLFFFCIINYIGSVPEWLKGADCKSVAFATLVQIQLGPFEILNIYYFFSVIILTIAAVLFVLKGLFNNLIACCVYITPSVVKFKLSDMAIK